MNIGLALGGFFVGVGLAAAGLFASYTTLNERTGANTANVKGLSERVVKATTGSWRLGYSVTGRGEVSASFDVAENHGARITDALVKAGFQQDEITSEPLKVSDEVRYNQEGEIIDRYHVIRSEVSITTNEPEKISPARGPVFALARDGLALTEYFVTYEFTKLNDIKPAMLREATENARIAANEFASNAGVSVGGIQSARQGGFQIRAANEAASEADALEKLVRVVTTITFYLEN